MTTQQALVASGANLPGTGRSATDKAADFLKALAQCRTVAAACRASGVSRRVVYDWRRRDPEFAAALDTVRDVDRGCLVTRLGGRRTSLFRCSWQEVRRTVETLDHLAGIVTVLRDFLASKPAPVAFPADWLNIVAERTVEHLEMYVAAMHTRHKKSPEKAEAREATQDASSASVTIY